MRAGSLPKQTRGPREPERGSDVVEKVNGSMADSREVMNIRQASQYLGVSPDTLYKYVGEQKIPAFKLGNRWRFKKSRLDQWMEEKSSEMEPQAKRKPKAASKAAGSQ
ncbi:Excisionase/Xis, DNA-binding protein (modular protein) [Acidobacteriia bacterium SbA2]|nr:Excisionase/Xis, DNA-binding protein (modular protein) [Acidobacteriia bacterium SbA2]